YYARGSYDIPKMFNQHTLAVFSVVLFVPFDTRKDGEMWPNDTVYPYVIEIDTF
ncbi:hypothetical protein Tco_1367631, partial [Tanacetum coccineum]